MPNWKKLLQHGKDAELNNLYLSGSLEAQSLTGSLDWSDLDNVPSLTGSQDLQSVTDNGNTTTNPITIDNDVFIGKSGTLSFFAGVGIGSGYQSIGIGYQALGFSNTSGSTAIGVQSGFQLIGGDYVTSIGTFSSVQTRASHSISIGYDSGRGTYGHGSINIGNFTGKNANNTETAINIGHNVNNSNSSALGKRIAIGYDIDNDKVNQIKLGGSDMQVLSANNYHFEISQSLESS